MVSVSAAFSPHHQPRCKVCKHPDRAQIDRLLATWHPYVRIEERFGVPYRSLANHRHRHLDFEDPAIAKAVEDEIVAFGHVHELGVEVAVERRLILDLFIQRYYEWLARAK